MNLRCFLYIFTYNPSTQTVSTQQYSNKQVMEILRNLKCKSDCIISITINVHCFRRMINTKSSVLYCKTDTTCRNGLTYVDTVLVYTASLFYCVFYFILFPFSLFPISHCFNFVVFEHIIVLTVVLLFELLVTHIYMHTPPVA